MALATPSWFDDPRQERIIPACWRFGSAGANSSIARTTNLPAQTWTAMGWFRITTDRNVRSTFISVDAGSGNLWIMQTGADGTGLNVYDNQVDNAGSQMTVGQWYHLTFVNPGATNILAYMNGVLDITSAGRGGVTPTKFWFGSDAAAEWLNGCGCAFKAWTRQLSVTEIATEMMSVYPISWNALNTWMPSPRIIGLPGVPHADLSGFAGHMTATGTVTLEESPPISWQPPAMWVGNSRVRRRFFSTQVAAGAAPAFIPERFGVSPLSGVGGWLS